MVIIYYFTEWPRGSRWLRGQSSQRAIVKVKQRLSVFNT
jgi:hypothetical protein